MLAAAVQAAVMPRTQRQPYFRPVVLTKVQRRGCPEIRKSEVPLVPKIVRRAVRNLGNRAVFAGNMLVDLRMINRVLVVLCGRPRKNEYVVSLAGLDLRRRRGTDFLYRNI